MTSERGPMDKERLQLLLSRYRSGPKSEAGESSMTSDFKISETATLPTPASITTSSVVKQPSSQSLTCCPSDNTLENQPVAKLPKSEPSCKPPIPPQASENNVPFLPTPLKSNVRTSNSALPSTDLSTPRFRRVPLQNLSSSRSLSSSVSSHDSSTTSTSINAAPTPSTKPLIKPYSTYSISETKNKENSASFHAPEPSESELSKVYAQLEEKRRAFEELRISSRKTEEKLKKENLELKKENEYIVAQYKTLSEKVSAHSALEGEGGLHSQLGQKVVIGDKDYNVQKDAIGKGASCRVYSGTDCSDNTQIAVKVVNLKKLPEAAVNLLQQEIALLRNLKEEENIIHIMNHEIRVNKSQLLIVLEFGESDLHDYLKTQKPLVKCQRLTSYYGVMAMWHQMLSAVHSIHKHNIIHKDLKPQNFLLVKGKLKLIDFGISERISADVTSMVINQPEGTPNYIAPELLGATFGSAASNRLGYCSDVYSLGCILYKMCFGVTPYQHIDKMQMKYCAITSPEPIKIPALPHKDLVQIISSCLNKDRQKRPTISDLMGFKGGDNKAD